MTTGLSSPPSAYPFESRYATVHGHRIHYVEKGDGAPILFLHGNPTSSYVWRNVLGPVAQATGRRAIAMDLLGFGRSANPGIDYSLDLHGRIVAGFIESLGLRDLVIVAEDWGGPLGAHWAVRNVERVTGMVFFETFLWPMNWTEDFDPKFRTPFKIMRSPAGFLMIQVMNMMVRQLIPQNCPISREALARYVDDLPTIRSRRAMRAFPCLLPIEGSPVESMTFFRSIEDGLRRFDRPVVWLLPTPGIVLSEEFPPSLKRIDWLKERLRRLDLRLYGSGHHFLAEEDPERLSLKIIEAVNGMDGHETSDIFQAEQR